MSQLMTLAIDRGLEQPPTVAKVRRLTCQFCGETAEWQNFHPDTCYDDTGSSYQLVCTAGCGYLDCYDCHTRFVEAPQSLMQSCFKSGGPSKRCPGCDPTEEEIAIREGYMPEEDDPSGFSRLERVLINEDDLIRHHAPASPRRKTPRGQKKAAHKVLPWGKRPATYQLSPREEHTPSHLGCTAHHKGEQWIRACELVRSTRQQRENWRDTQLCDDSDDLRLAEIIATLRHHPQLNVTRALKLELIAIREEDVSVEHYAGIENWHFVWRRVQARAQRQRLKNNPT